MYVIHFIGIFQEGFVKSRRGHRIAKIVPITTYDYGIEFASKYRFKFIADLFCAIYNWSADQNCKLITFKVKKI